MPKDLQDLFEPLKNQLIWVHAKWNISQQLFDHSKERLELLSRIAPSFFRIMDFVYRDDLFISICRLTDQTKQQSLNRLIKILKNHMNHQKYTDLTAIMANINQKTVPLTEWRNRKIAHSELVMNIKKGPDPLPEVTRNSINEVLEDMRKLMDEVEVYFTGNSTAYEYVALQGDGNNIAYILSEYENQRIEKIKSFQDQEK